MLIVSTPSLQFAGAA